ncbi:universal stress protein [Ammonicoccus fulvus]|uniref:Universal stress protein n=1 Tax=Ammonicoccus fulvus TaxID=3138240 RepID=A0ABZ3FT99_9ACTN
MTEDSQQRPRVVVGVDGSEDGIRAVEFGVRTALAQDADLLLAHAVDDAVLAGAWGVVYDPNLLEEAGQEAAEEAKAKALSMGFPAERVKSKIYMGNPGAVLTRLSEKALVLVVGRRALSGLERLFVGSTSVGVAATAHCPVIMLSAATHQPRTGDKGRVGVGIHIGEPSNAALAFAFSEARRRSATLEVIHTFELPTSFFADRKQRSDRAHHQEEAHRDVLDQLLAPHRENYPEVPVEITLVQAHPVNELNSRSADFDLLVLEVHGRGLPVFSPGATIRAVMAYGQCPLALVRDTK